MRLSIKILLSLLISLAPSVFYFYSLYKELFFINSVIYVLILCVLLVISFKFSRNNFIENTFIFMIFFGIIFSYLINYQNYASASYIELIRFFAYFIFFVFLISFVRDYNIIDDAVKYAAFIYTLFVLISLTIIVVFGSDFHDLIILNASFSDDSILSAHTIYSDNMNYNRFSIPGLNSNTVTIISSLFAGFFLNRFLKNNEYKFLNTICFYILVLSIFLTLSRQGFVYIFILLFFFCIANFKKIIYLSSLLFLVLFFVDFEIIYFMLLATVDAFFGSTYSQGLINNTSERENLINESLAHISQNFWGASIESISILHEAATGEHLLYLYLISLYGYIVGLSFFSLSFYIVYKFYSLLKYNIFYTYDSLTYFYFSVICFVSAFFAPSYYINFTFLGLCYVYFNCKDAILKDLDFSATILTNKKK